jgi:hypothetical protein
MLPSGHTCVACGRAISALDHYAYRGTCDSLRCRGPLFRRLREEQRLAERRQEEQREGRRRVLEALRDRCVQAEGLSAAEPCPVLAVPLNGRPLAALPESRRQRFAQHLLNTIEAAFYADGAASPAPAVASPGAEPEPYRGEPAAVLAEACAACGGRCCLNGGDTAYLSPAAILRLRRRHPEATAVEVYDAYWSRLPSQAYQDSCVCHGPEGCSLPPQLRSETCNAFSCEGLERVRSACGEGHGWLFLAAGEGDDVRRCRLVPVPPVRKPQPAAPVG